MSKKFSSFDAFYPFYLTEHANRTSRRLHFAGTTGVILLLLAAIALGEWRLLILLPVVGYGLAWVGHFFFEKNRPATFEHPVYSLLADFVMFRDMLFGRIPF